LSRGHSCDPFSLTRCARGQASLFSEPLNPVAQQAQKKVPVPKGLDLDTPINQAPESEDEEEGERALPQPTAPD
jgi:hypothetical protein